MLQLWQSLQHGVVESTASCEESGAQICDLYRKRYTVHVDRVDQLYASRYYQDLSASNLLGLLKQAHLLVLSCRYIFLLPGHNKIRRARVGAWTRSLLVCRRAMLKQVYTCR
jgi:hypothetical protein